jgi:hypothetical protein
MKLVKYLFVICFFVAALVPTELFHYVHTATDLSEHYEHHRDKSFVEFISHALSSSSDCDTDHPEHHHSPFSHHHTNCGTTLVSILPAKITPTFEYFHFSQNNQVFALANEPFVSEVSLAIWQPPKLV